MTTDNRQPFIEGLRKLADWYEAHPEVPTPSRHSVTVPYPHEGKAAAAAMARLLSPCKKEMDNHLLILTKDFGPAVELRVPFWRNQICTRIVVGIKEVPAAVIPAHTEEIVKWDCAALLEDTL